jgi:proline-specific peptidase
VASRRVSLHFQDGFVRAAGHRFYWKSIGKPERGTLLCLHGGPGVDHWSTIETADLAPFGIRVVFFDQLGCGKSDRLRSYRGYDIRQAAREVEAVRRGLDLGQCVLYGYSYGAALGLQTILDHPHGFARLILSSVWASQAELDGETQKLIRALKPSARRAIIECEASGRTNEPQYLAALGEFRRRYMFGGTVPPFEISLGLANMNQELFQAFVGSDSRLSAPTGGSMAGWDVTSRLAEVQVPTLITVGGRDHVTPHCARTVQRGIAGSRLVVFPRGGHSHAYTERARYMELLLGFVLQS